MTRCRKRGETMTVDVIICTRNREGSIEAAVRGVLANDYPDLTLTVVDQSTSTATGDVLAAIVATDTRLRYVHIDEAGLSHAYNTGIDLTSADVLAFTDDDCLVPSDWVSSIASAFDSETDGDLLYGNVIAFDAGDESALTPSVVIERAQKLTRDDGFTFPGMGANFAGRRRLFDKIGGFDEVLGGGGPLRSSQDSDLTYRAMRAGAVVLLRPEVTLRHDGRREKDDWPTLLLNYGTGDGAFYTKHVRCGDAFAAWLLTKRLVETTAKNCIKFVLRQDTPGFNYLRGLVAGIRGSFRFDVDRENRLYVKPGRSAAS